MRSTLTALCLLLCLGNTAPAVVPTPNQTLTAHETGVPPARYFGQSMASNGQTLAVGAPYAVAGGGAAPGVVLLYQRGANGWNYVQALQAPVPANGDSFGFHLSFAGDQLLVSAPFSTASNVSERGIVYAYQPVANTYTLAQTINPGATVSSFEWFGFHSSADSGWLAISVPLRGAFDSGQVQLYYVDGDSGLWVYHSLVNGVANNGRYGLRVLLRGDRLLIGAPEEVATGNDRGFVYELQRSGVGASATWAQVQRFRITGSGISVFGAALALSADASRLLVGAPYQATPDGQATVGTVVAFTRGVGGAWTQSARIDPPSLSVARNFGGSLAFLGNDILIGDIREGSASLLGAAHGYRQVTPNTWVRMASWKRGTGSDSDFMGGSLIGIGTEVLIGAPGIDVGASLDEGQVFVFADALPLFRDGLE